jgi:hypothetical protein
VGFLEEGGAESVGDVEAVVGGGVEYVVMEDEVGASAVGDGAEDVLVGGVGGGFLADGVEEGGGDGKGGADGGEENVDGWGFGVAGEGVGGDVGGAGFVNDGEVKLSEEVEPMGLAVG